MDWEPLRRRVARAFGESDHDEPPPDPEPVARDMDEPSPAHVNVNGTLGAYHRVEARQGEFVSITAGDQPACMWIPSHAEVVVRAMGAAVVLDIGQGMDFKDTVSTDKQITDLTKQIHKLERRARASQRQRRALDRWSR